MLNSANGKVLDESAFLTKILPFLEHLDGLELLCLGATDKIVKAISTKIPNLKSLSLFGPGITNETVANLTKECPNLIKIHLLNSHLSTPGIQTIANNFPKLETLGVSGPNLKDSDFTALGAALGAGKPNLRSLSIVGHNFKDMATVANLLKAMPKLHTLDISETNVTDAVAKSIAETKGLKSLNISETKITKEGIKEIVQNLDLTTFKINNLPGISDNELELIAKSQPGLRKFHFSGTSFSDSGLIDVIWDLKKLNDVTLIPISGSKWILSEAIARALVRKKTKIQYLHIQADRLPEALRMKIENGIPNIRIEYQ
jgi:Leucine-rich repeat (LRR) protein